MMKLISKYFSINPQAVASNYRELVRLYHGFLLALGTLSPVLCAFLYCVLDPRSSSLGGLIVIVLMALMPLFYLINKIILNLFFGIIYVFLNIADQSSKTAKEVRYIRMKRFPSE
jgi:hypothetical protein